MPTYPLSFWKNILPYLDVWADLTLDLRRAALELPQEFHPLPQIWAVLTKAALEKLFETDTEDRRRPLPGFRNLIGFLDRLSVWSLSDRIDITRHIQELTTPLQRQALAGLRAGQSPEATVAAVERKLVAGEFARSFLDSGSPEGFLATVSQWFPEDLPLTGEHHSALRAWLRMAAAEGVRGFTLHSETFRKAPGNIPPQDLIHLALGFGCAILARNPDSLAVVLQPALPDEDAAQKPENVVMKKAKTDFHFARPYLIDDMDFFLRSLKTNDVRLLNDGRFPVVHLRKVAKRLHALPGPLPTVGFDSEERAKAAWWMIERMELVFPEGPRTTWKFVLTEKGADWMRMSREMKMELLLAAAPCGRNIVRSANEARDESEFWLEDDIFEWLGDYESISIPYEALTTRVFEWLNSAFARLTESTEHHGWFTSAVTLANPFVADSKEDAELKEEWGYGYDSPQNAYAMLLHHFLGRLCSMGAVAIGHDAKGNLGLSLTAIGRYLFRLSETWALPVDVRPVAVVGADFSIVLLEPSPALSLELSAFAEPVGHLASLGQPPLPGQPRTADPITTGFRLTRRSIQAAVHGGLPVQDILTTLRACSKTAVPANVIHEIEAWAKSKQSVRLSEAILLKGEDPLVMAEILSRFPKDFIQVSPLALEYIGAETLSALGKKLNKKGFFTD